MSDEAASKVPTFEERLVGAEDCDTPESREHFIGRLMVADLWPKFPESTRFRAMLAEIWQLSDSSVRRYATTAHRLIAFDPEERDMMRAELASTFAGYARIAVTSRNQVTGLPDLPSAIKATELVGKYLGLEPETKVQHGGSIALDTIDALKQRMALAAGVEADVDAPGPKPEG